MTHYHLIGIGGTGLSAIARVLFERGSKVSGSDALLSPQVQELVKLGIPVSIGHNPNNILGADLIIRSSAIPESNPEITAALSAGIPILKRREFLPELTAGYKVVAIAGTHGKTTTTSMIAWCLSELGADPSYVIGGMVKNLGRNAHSGGGEFFIIEADEYDQMFLGLKPDLLIITNIEHDHPDCFPTKEDYFNAFLELTQNIQPEGKLIACADHPGVSRLLKQITKNQKFITYGTKPNSTYRINHISHIPGCGVHASLMKSNSNINGKFNYRLNLPIPGIHNALNGAGAIAAIDTMGFSPQKAILALEKFQGAGRRFDIIGTVNGITIIDDYAHHPSEIQTTLAAARCRYPGKKIWTVWQPHTYSRTRELFDDFIISFNDSDHVIVTEIYASREKEGAFSSTSLVESMKHPDVKYFAKLEQVSRFLMNTLKHGDVLLVLSAGDATNISRDVMNHFKNQEKTI